MLVYAGQSPTFLGEEADEFKRGTLLRQVVFGENCPAGAWKNNACLDFLACLPPERRSISGSGSSRGILPFVSFSGKIDPYTFFSNPDLAEEPSMTSPRGKSCNLPEEMTAAFFEGGNIYLRSIPVPEPSKGEALLRTRVSGICATDLELLRGYQDFTGVAGHEFVADTVRAPGARDLEGSRVVADINCGCGECRLCLGGQPHHCSGRSVLGIRGRQGAFAEYLCVPLQNLHPVPDRLSDHSAVFAEPLAAVLRISQQIHMRADMDVAILGDGKMGLLAAMALRHHCPGLLLIGRHSKKLDIFARAGGRVLQMGKKGRELEELNSAFHLVIEATGQPGGLQQAARICRPEGTIALKTTTHRPWSFSFSSLVVNEQRILGSRCGDPGLALHYLQQGLVDASVLIEEVHSWPRIQEAMERAASRGSKKVLLDFNSSRQASRHNKSGQPEFASFAD